LPEHHQSPRLSCVVGFQAIPDVSKKKIIKRSQNARTITHALHAIQNKETYDEDLGQSFLDVPGHHTAFTVVLRNLPQLIVVLHKKGQVLKRHVHLCVHKQNDGLSRTKEQKNKRSKGEAPTNLQVGTQGFLQLLGFLPSTKGTLHFLGNNP
jgi:hypothetical protein